MFPAKFSDVANHTNVVIYNCRKLKQVEVHTHIHEGFQNAITIIFNRKDREDDKLGMTKNYNVRYDLVQLPSTLDANRK